MPRRCVVPGCPNRRRIVMPGIAVRFHFFPKSNDMRQKWMKACRRKDLNFVYACLCSIHFRDTDYERDLKAELLGYEPRKFLKKDAIPSLNLPQRTGPPQIKLRDKCVLITCPNHYAELDNVLFFKLPEDIHLRKEWIYACKLEPTSISDTSQICSEHFLDCDYVSGKADELNVPSKLKAVRNLLKKDAVPSLNLPDDIELLKRQKNYKKTLDFVINSKLPAQGQSNVLASELIVCDTQHNVEFSSRDYSNSSVDPFAGFDSSSESLDKLQVDLFSNSEVQEQFKTVMYKLSKSGKNVERTKLHTEAQGCSNCSAAEMELKNMNEKLLQVQKQMSDLEEENKKLKEKLGEINKSKLQEEMEKIFNGVLSRSQLELLSNLAQNSNSIKEDLASTFKLKPIGTYRLYNIPK